MTTCLRLSLPSQTLLRPDDSKYLRALIDTGATRSIAYKSSLPTKLQKKVESDPEGQVSWTMKGGTYHMNHVLSTWFQLTEFAPNRNFKHSFKIDETPKPSKNAVDEGAEIFESLGRERVWDGNGNLRHVVLCLFVCVFLLVFIEVEAFCLTVVIFVVTVAVWFFVLMMFILMLALALAASVVSILTLVVLVLVVSVVVLVAVAVAVAVVAVAVVLALVPWVLAALIPRVAIQSVEMTINLVVVVVLVSSAVS